MTEEEKMLDIFKKEVEKEQSEYEQVNDYTQFVYDNHKNILNLIQKQQEEINRLNQEQEEQDDYQDNRLLVDVANMNAELGNKDKVIDLMANYIYATDYRSECGSTREQVKQYFEKKIKESNNG